jgi:hypothetical protein
MWFDVIVGAYKFFVEELCVFLLIDILMILRYLLFWLEGIK